MRGDAFISLHFLIDVKGAMVVLTSRYSDRFVDVRHLTPPMILMTLSKAIRQIDCGQILAACATDTDTRREIPAWCETIGARLIETTERHGLLTFYIQRVS